MTIFIRFLLFVSSIPQYQAEFEYIETGLLLECALTQSHYAVFFNFVLFPSVIDRFDCHAIKKK